MQAILTIGRALAGARTRQSVLDVVTGEPLVGLLGATGILVLLRDEENRTLLVRAQRGDAFLPPGETSFSFDAPLSLARAAAKGEVEVDESNRTVAVPLIAGDEPFGVAVLRRDTDRPSPDEIEVLRLWGDQVAAALSRTGAMESESHLREVFRTAAKAISRALSTVPESNLHAAIQREFRLWPSVRQEMLPDFLRTTLRVFVEQAMEVTGAQIGALGVGESPTQPFNPWVFVGVSEEEARAIGRIPRPVGTFAVVAGEGKTVRVADVRTHPAFHGLPPHHPEVTSFLGVPIRYRATSLGNLYLGNKHRGEAFTRADQEAAEMLGSLAAIALQQAYLRASMDAQRTELQIILDSAPHGIVFVDAKSASVTANPRAMQLFGHPFAAGDAASHFASHVLRVDGRPLPESELPSSRALHGETVAPSEFVLLRPDESRLPVLLSAAPVRSLEGDVVGAVVNFEDISTFKDLERLREEFAAVVAHDLRDPIQVLLFELELLGKSVTDDEVRLPIRRLRAIEKTVNRLGQMTNDFLDASRIELRRIRLDREWIPLRPELSDLVARLRPLLGLHPVSVDVDERVGTAWVDPRRFEQILTNLLDNAAKYSPATAPIQVRLAAESGGVRVSVEDRGMGISADEMPLLFDRFYQGRRARDRKTGLGLGLYITKGLVEAHGGWIRVESAPGRGSTFVVWLPVSAPAEEASSPSASSTE